MTATQTTTPETGTTITLTAERDKEPDAHGVRFANEHHALRRKQTNAGPTHGPGTSCTRDHVMSSRHCLAIAPGRRAQWCNLASGQIAAATATLMSVSYTHLTLPTICSV
eukprot:11186431-Lingulodinium_polyedra.AAC.1